MWWVSKRRILCGGFLKGVFMGNVLNERRILRAFGGGTENETFVFFPFCLLMMGVTADFFQKPSQAANRSFMDCKNIQGYLPPFGFIL